MAVRVWSLPHFAGCLVFMAVPRRLLVGSRLRCTDFALAYTIVVVDVGARNCQRCLTTEMTTLHHRTMTLLSMAGARCSRRCRRLSGSNRALIHRHVCIARIESVLQTPDLCFGGRSRREYIYLHH